MVAKRHGEEVMASYKEKLVHVEAAQQAYKMKINNGQYDLIYKFGEGLIDENEIDITETEMTLPGFANPIELSQENPFKDMV